MVGSVAADERVGDVLDGSAGEGKVTVGVDGILGERGRKVAGEEEDGGGDKWREG